MRLRRLGGLILACVLAAPLLVDTGAASNVVVGLSDSGTDVTIPTWLYLATGAGVVGASALLTAMVTDRVVLEGFRQKSLGPALGQFIRPGGLALGGVLSLAIAFVLAVGLLGPDRGLVSAAVLLVFVGGRSIATGLAYLVVNPWPQATPWRVVASSLPTADRPYPEWLGSWPAVGGLLGFVWLEVVTPLSASARTLVAVVLVYLVVTIAGAVVFQPRTWFERADPLVTWFRLYGSVAPIQRTEAGLELRIPGSRLTDADVITHPSQLGFVLAIIWELTFSGFIVTPPGTWTIETLVGLGVPAPLVYLVLLLGGFGLFWAAYWVAAEVSRRQTATYLDRRTIALRFAAPLIAIAAGYHIAHYAGFAISLLPSLVDTTLAPLAPPPNPTRLALPGWFGYIEIAGILLGHVLAVWVGHVVSFELFPGTLQSIRSQYSFVAIMILFTMLSLYLVSLPTSPAPFAPG
ncbi:MAG: hypothetical protein U5K37_04000 [Natrialbaceae archaeon]|nr:hypothetical protein [Natrialbaceae archaeon]